MEKITLVVSEDFIRSLLQGVEVQGKGYETFIKKPPHIPPYAYYKGIRYKKPLDNLSSMLYYLIDSLERKEQKTALDKIILEAGIDGSLEEIFFGFETNRPGEYLLSVLNYPTEGGVWIMPDRDKSDIRKEALEYLRDNEGKPCLLVVDQTAGKALSKLNTNVKKV